MSYYVFNEKLFDCNCPINNNIYVSVLHRNLAGTGEPSRSNRIFGPIG
jgi:hypothetical protein